MLVGCSPSVTGGDTKCKDFLERRSRSTQNEAVIEDVEGREGRRRSASLEITGTRLSVQTFCQTAGTPDSKIKEAPHL